MTLTLEVLPDPERLAGRAVEILEALGAEKMGGPGRFVVSLAGGSTPKAAYRLWGERSRLDWRRVRLLYGDERCVAPDHPDSNAGMVEAALLAGLDPAPEVFRMRGEDAEPAAAARDYGRQLKAMLDGGDAIDLAVLGIGGDGHTASLFPGREAVAERHHLCVETVAPDGKTNRITLTLPALRQAKRILFLAAGAGKADILQKVVKGPFAPESLPSQFLLRDETLAVTLLADEAAAAKLG